jgi:hypothetical protein
MKVFLKKKINKYKLEQEFIKIGDILYINGAFASIHNK